MVRAEPVGVPPVVARMAGVAWFADSRTLAGDFGGEVQREME